MTLPCEENICQNGGTCTKHVTDYSCDCPTGYSGYLCDEFDGNLFFTVTFIFERACLVLNTYWGCRSCTDILNLALIDMQGFPEVANYKMAVVVLTIRYGSVAT